MSLPDSPRQPNLDEESASSTARFAVPRRLGLWTLLLVSLFVLAPIVRPGHIQTNAGFLPAFNVIANNALAQVGTTPDLWRSDGIAAYVPAQPLLLMGVSPATAVEIVLVGSLLLGALAIYVWLFGRFGDRAAGLAAIVYLCLPVTLATVYMQGSMGGAVALAMIPLALAGMENYARQRSLMAAAVTALAILWLWRTQTGIALVASIVLILYAWIIEARRGTLLLVIGSVAAGAISIIPIWGAYDPAAPDFVAQFGTLYGLLRATPIPSEPVQFGVVAFALAAVALWSVWTSDLLSVTLFRRLITFCAVTSLTLFLLGMSFFAPLWQMSGADRLFAAPWMLAVAGAPFLAAAAGGSMLAFPALRVIPYGASLVVLIVLAAQPWLQPAITYMTPPREPVAILGDNQIAILATELKPNDVTGETHLDVTWQVLKPLPTDYNIFVQAMSGGATPEKIAQIDVAPLADSPATTWRPGDLLRATYTIFVPVEDEGTEESTAEGTDEVTEEEALPVDAYWYGWYNWQDGARLPVNMGLDDKMVLHGD